MEIIPTAIKNPSLVKEKREQIILSAIKLFSRKGYHNASLKELSKEADISYGNIYDYVSKKEDIFYLIHAHVHKCSQENIDVSLKGIKNPLEKLKRLIRAEVNFMYEWNDAVLLMYRETHILMKNKKYLNNVLKKEKEHRERIASVLEECAEKGFLRPCDIVLVSNLIKIMCEVCVLRRWDLKRKFSKSDLANTIIGLISSGLFQEKESVVKNLQDLEGIKGKAVLIINGGTQIGKAIIPFLHSKGLRLAIHGSNLKADSTFFVSHQDRSDRIEYYCYEDYGPISVDLLKKIEDEFGALDIIIQDLGSGIDNGSVDSDLVGQELEANLQFAQELAKYLNIEMRKRDWGRILYFAPWISESHIDPVKYRIIKSGIVTLTRTMAELMASSKIKVNCLVPGHIEGMGGAMQEAGVSETMKHSNIGSSEELSNILETVHFLISDSAKCLTGQALEVALDA